MSIARHPDTHIIEAQGTYASDNTGGYVIVAYAYGLSREDILCVHCAQRRNHLANARPIADTTITELGEIECAFCGQII